MKRNDWLLLSAVSVYSFLFYRQSPGINFVIFNFVLLGCLAIKNKRAAKSKRWLLVALGCLASAFCVGYYGNLLSVIANIISLSFLSALSINRNSSFVISLISSTCAYFASPFNMILDSMERNQKQSERHVNYWKRAMLIGIPIIITLVFFFLYRASNPLFDNLAQKINLDFISLSWILFTFLGLFLLYGFFHQRKLESLSNWDERPRTLENKEYKTLKLFGKDLNITDENLSGLVLFVLLNILVLIVNLGDINFLVITHKLPQGMSYSEFVHQGIDALIVSIIIAIAIVLFYFRGGLNFFAKSKAIKVLACIWILQNAFMIYSTSCRNTLYISECGLTFKRIGVYVYLMLALTGLATTLVKIIKAKSNSYLFRINGWFFYGFLIILSFPNWDRLVTNYNVKNNKTDYPEYMFTLSYSNIPDLLPLYSAAINKQEDAGVKNFHRLDIEKAFSLKLYNFISQHDTLEWRSWYYDDADTYNAVSKSEFIDSVTNLDYSYTSGVVVSRLSLFKKLTKLNMADAGLDTIDGVVPFTNLKELDLSSNHLKEIKGISKLVNLQKLNLAYTSLPDLSGIEGLQKLEELNLYNDTIGDLSVLCKLPSLSMLTISNYKWKDLTKIKDLQNIKKLDVSCNQLDNLNGVERLQGLEELNLSINTVSDYAPLYKLQHLKKLVVRSFGMQDSTIAEISKNMPNTKVSKY
jgi:hypothetical protein